MSNQYYTLPFVSPPLDLTNEYLESFDIESSIYLIEKYVLRIKESHLKQFYFTFFTS